MNKVQDNDADGAKTRKWSWTRVLLVVSLALNLLVAGAVAGAFLSGGKDRGGDRRAESRLPMGPYARAFPKEDRAELRRAFEARKPWFDEQRTALRGAAEELVQVLRAEPFDPVALRAVLARQTEKQTEIRAEGQKIFAERLVAMTNAQRQRFADRVEKGLRRGKGRN